MGIFAAKTPNSHLLRSLNSISSHPISQFPLISQYSDPSKTPPLSASLQNIVLKLPYSAQPPLSALLGFCCFEIGTRRCKTYCPQSRMCVYLFNMCGGWCGDICIEKDGAVYVFVIRSPIGFGRRKSKRASIERSQSMSKSMRKAIENNCKDECYIYIYMRIGLKRSI